jgi:hypothetical protein
LSQYVSFSANFVLLLGQLCLFRHPCHAMSLSQMFDEMLARFHSADMYPTVRYIMLFSSDEVNLFFQSRASLHHVGTCE